MNQKHIWNDLEHVNDKKEENEPITATILEGVAGVRKGWMEKER